MSRKKYENQYFNPAHEASFSGARKLLSVNKKDPPKRIHEWLSNQDAFTLHKPVRKKFQRLHYNVHMIDAIWETDLVDVQALKTHNDGYNYLLVVIDVFSKFCWVQPMKDKTGASVVKAFENILARANGRVPVYLQSDRGKEFVCTAFQKYLKRNGILFGVASNPDVKAAVVERFNRTLKERIWRYFTYRNTHRYIDVLQDLVRSYNNTPHSSIKFTPASVTIHNAIQVRANLEKSWQRNDKKYVKRRPIKTAKFKVGDHVRISRSKQVFEKGFVSGWSEEIFLIVRVTKRQNYLYTYELEDLQGEKIEGFFYTEELTLVGKKRVNKNSYKIESIIKWRGRGKKREALVKWIGYPNKFNSWVLESDLVSIHHDE